MVEHEFRHVNLLKRQFCLSFCESFANLVDGPPPARHIEAFGGPHGSVRPATIHALDPQKLTN